MKGDIEEGRHTTKAYEPFQEHKSLEIHLHQLKTQKLRQALNNESDTTSYI